MNMTRLQRILTAYLLWELSREPKRIFKHIRHVSQGAVSVHGNEKHTSAYITSSEGSGAYVDESGDTMTGNLNMGGNNISNVGAFTASTVGASAANVSTITALADQLYSNNVDERTAGSGVTVDGVALKDGGATFAANVDLDVYELLFDDVKIQQHPSIAGNLRFRRTDVAADAGITVSGCRTDVYTGVGTYNRFDTAYGVNNSYSMFRAYNNAGGYEEVARIIGGASNRGFSFIIAPRVDSISASGTPATQTKYMPVNDGGTTRYIMLYDSVS